MAVNSADISALEAQMSELKGIMQSKSAEIERERQRIATETQEKLDALNDKVLNDMENRDRIVREEYAGLLDSFVANTHGALEKEYKELQAQYSELDSKLKSALAVEQHKSEELYIKQRDFEAAYNSRQEYAKAQAFEILEQAAAMLDQLRNHLPVEWFMPGRIDLYKKQLNEIKKWISAALYESAIGIGENMLLSMKLDRIEAEERFWRWFHYYTVLCEAINAEKKLIFESALTIGSKYRYFSMIAEKEIINGMMSKKLADDWSGEMYSKLCRSYAQLAKEIGQFHINGVVMTDPAELRAFMISHPGESFHFQEMAVYSSAMKAIQRISESKHQIGRMFDRINAFEERYSLAVSIRKALKKINCELSNDKFYSSPSETMHLTFTDSMRIYTFEVFLIPILRRADDRYVNFARCNIPEDISRSDKEDITHALADVLVTKNIKVYYDVLNRERTMDERIKLAVTDIQLIVNGRLN